MIKCIIVEDQRPAQKILERYISDIPELNLIGVFNNAIEATTYLKTNEVDLIFLDIHLPKLSGVDFLKIIPKPPKVIFTTAFPDYALDGFELNAVDYLLKPFDFGRFYQAINKVLGSQKVDNSGQEQKTTDQRPLNYHFAKLDRELIRITFDDIKFIKAAGDFVNIFFEEKKLFLSESLKIWEDRLSKNDFIKVHKSYIVRLDQIEKVSGNTIHINGEVIPIGRMFRQAFLDRINL